MKTGGSHTAGWWKLFAVPMLALFVACGGDDLELDDEDIGPAEDAIEQQEEEEGT